MKGKGKIKKILATLLVFIMLASLGACSQSSGDDEKADSTVVPTEAASGEGAEAVDEGAAEATEAVAEDGPLTPYKDTVTITWAAQTAAVQQFFDGDDYEINRWTKKIKDELNIEVKLDFSADISTDAYRNKMNTLLATGEFPDVVRWNDRNFFKQAVDAGYVADITDVFNEYATDAVKQYQTQYPDSFHGVSKNDRLYGFPYMTDNFHQAAYLWIRDDWLKNTNSQAPTTIDEMVELARKFTYEDPDKNGKDDTYGLALNKNVVQSNYATLLGLVGAYGIPGYGAGGVFYRGDDGKITFPYIQPGMKDALAVVRGMYEEGLIDPEFVVKDIATLETDIGTGKIGMMYHMNWGDWHPFNISYQNEGVITRPYPIPTVEGIDYKMGIESNEIGDVFMISSTCEHPEAIIKILNLYNKTVYESTSSEDFNTYWANEQYRLCPIFVGIPTELFAPQIFSALEKGNGDDLPLVARENYLNTVGFADGTKTTSDAYGTWGQMFERGSMAIALNDYRKDNALVTNIMTTDIPDIWLQNSSVLQTMVETAITDIITGAKPLDSFDDFVQDWLNAGGQETLDEMEKMYPAGK